MSDENESTGPSAKRPRTESAEAIVVVEDSAGPSDKPASDRPTDEEILKYMDVVKAETVLIHPFIGERERLDTLYAEYESGSQIYRDKIRFLQQHYRGWRRSRGDGNCFLRSFLFNHLENIILLRDTAERDRLVKVLEEFKTKKLSNRYQPDISDDFIQPLIDLVSSLVNPHVSFTVENLTEQFSGDAGPSMIYSLRMICGSELVRREEHFTPFVLGMTDEGYDVSTFVQNQVDAIDVECDHIQIVALSDALNIPLRVMYLDNTPMSFMTAEGSELVSHVDFTAELAGEAAKPRVHLLYRPGHYDIIYPD